MPKPPPKRGALGLGLAEPEPFQQAGGEGRLQFGGDFAAENLRGRGRPASLTSHPDGLFVAVAMGRCHGPCDQFSSDFALTGFFSGFFKHFRGEFHLEPTFFAGVDFVCIPLTYTTCTIHPNNR